MANPTPDFFIGGILPGAPERRPVPRATRPRTRVEGPFVPVDFEAGQWALEQLGHAGFDARRPAIVASTDVSMYLTKDAILATLRELVTLATGSTFVMSFRLPIELADPEVRPGIEAAARGARRDEPARRRGSRVRSAA